MPVISILYGSVRTRRMGIRVANFLLNKLKQRGHKTYLVDPMEYHLPLLDKRFKDYPAGEAPSIMQELSGIFNESDGFMIVSGEYNHGIPPALKNLLDHFLQEYYFKPSAIATYSMGNFGGVRSGVQLRDVLAELGMPAIPISQPFANISEILNEQGELQKPSMEKFVNKFLEEFDWYLEAFKNQRLKGTPY